MRVTVYWSWCVYRIAMSIWCQGRVHFTQTYIDTVYYDHLCCVGWPSGCAQAIQETGGKCLSTLLIFQHFSGNEWSALSRTHQKTRMIKYYDWRKIVKVSITLLTYRTQTGNYVGRERSHYCRCHCNLSMFHTLFSRLQHCTHTTHSGMHSTLACPLAHTHTHTAQCNRWEL